MSEVLLVIPSMLVIAMVWLNHQCWRSVRGIIDAQAEVAKEVLIGIQALKADADELRAWRAAHTADHLVIRRKLDRNYKATETS